MLNINENQSMRFLDLVATDEESVRIDTFLDANPRMRILMQYRGESPINMAVSRKRTMRYTMFIPEKEADKFLALITAGL